MISKDQALVDIVALASAHHISIEEITSALGRQQIEANKKNIFTLTQLFSYLGGIFILAGLSGYIAMTWDSLNSLARIVITLGPGIICLIMAVAFTKQHARERSATALITLSALLQSTGLFVAIYEFSTGGGNASIAAFLVFGVLAVQYGICFKQLKRTAFLFFTLAFVVGSFISLCDWIDIPDDLTGLICGASLLALSYGVQRTAYNSICGFGYFVSSIVLLWVGFDLLQNSVFEIAFIGLACFMLYVSTIVRSRSILATASISLFSYIGYFSERYFLDSIGWPIFLILLGCLFFGMSHAALKLNKRYFS